MQSILLRCFLPWRNHAFKVCYLISLFLNHFFLFLYFFPNFFFLKHVKIFYLFKRHAIYDKTSLFWGWNCVKFHTENADPVCSIKWSNQLEPMGITKLQAPAHVSLILDVEHLKKFHLCLFHESSAFHTWNFVHKISSIPPLKIHEWHFGWLLMCKKRKSEWTTFHGWNTFLDYISWMTFISS